MKKNNRGFTLVELLAAIVIIGILSVLSIPVITGMIDRSRNKIYITDAKKLISQAEYKIRAASSNVEKPDPGDCIALSLVYLDSADLDDPPYGGTYEKESSFVLVKNNNGKLEYSATIVEKMKKGGYKGVELTTNEELISSNATKHVVVFEKDKIITVEDGLTNNYINSKLGTDSKKYIENGNRVSAIYNYPDLVDNSSQQIVDKKPNIVKATMTSTSNKSYNSLDATLTLKVVDDDTPGSKLTVRITGPGINITEKYGSSGVYTKNFNFANSGYSYSGSNRKVTLNVSVSDTDGNAVSKSIPYEIHRNSAPVIDTTNTKLTKRPADMVNMISSLLKLSVSDDIDDVKDLQICFSESTSSTKPSSCSGNYKKFYEYFSSGTENNYVYEYKFNCGGNAASKCSRDGSTHYLTVFVKDTGNLVSSQMFPYTFSVNQAPVISRLVVESIKGSVPSTGHMMVSVNMDIDDDSDERTSLKVYVTSGGSTREYKSYNDNHNNVFDFTIPNVTKYDGSNKSITVKVEDPEGLSTSKTVNYAIYNNQAPTITGFNVYSDGVACNEYSLCPDSEGGSKNALIALSLTDDLDRDNNYGKVKVCVSENPSDCNNVNNLSNYLPYSNYSSGQKKFTISGEYDGSEKIIYAYAIDSYNKMSQPATYRYKLYKDQAPTIGLFLVESQGDIVTSDGSLNANFYIDAYDDYEDVDSLKFELLVDGDVVINKSPLSDYLYIANNIKLPGTYDGKDRKIVARVYDKSNTLSTTNVSEFTYPVYLKNLPEIRNIDIKSAEVVCTDSSTCSDSENNSLKVNYSISVDDVAESEFGDLLICVSENQTCTDYTSISNYIDGQTKESIQKQFTFTNNTNKPYDGSTKILHVFLKNKNSTSETNIRHSEISYDVYQNNAPVLSGLPQVRIGDSPYGVNISDIYYSVGVKDDLDNTSDIQITYCRTIDGGSETCTGYQNYQGEVHLDNSFFGVSSYTGQNVNIYAYVKDSYNADRKIGEYTYKLFEDEKPVLNYVTGAYDTIYKDRNGNVVTDIDYGNLNQYTIEYTNYRISFNVVDYYDTYGYCISENSNSCTNYSNSIYDGNLKISSTANLSNYDKSKHYYLFIKDSHNKIADEKLEFSFDEYGRCANKDINSYRYEYVFDSSKEYYNPNGSVISNNQKISADVCGGKCYSGGNTSITSYYDRIISYLDGYNQTDYCVTQESRPGARYNSNYAFKADCSFKDCFYKNNNYQRKAIGTTRITVNNPFTATVNGHPYTCNAYYKLYYSSYKQYDKNITLTLTNDKICAEAVDAGEYNYNSSSNDPYVRVADGG